MCSTGVLDAGYHNVAVNVQHRYVSSRLLDYNGKCAAFVC